MEQGAQCNAQKWLPDFDLMRLFDWMMSAIRKFSCVLIFYFSFLDNFQDQNVMRCQLKSNDEK